MGTCVFDIIKIVNDMDHVGDFVLMAVPDDVPLVEDVGEVESEIEADGDADGDTLLDALVERDMERVAVLVTVTLPVRDCE